MRNLILLLMACILLRAASAVIAALLIALLMLFIWGALVHPLRLAGFAVFLMVAKLLEVYPGWTLLLVGLLAVMGLFKGKSPQRADNPHVGVVKALPGPQEGDQKS